MRFSENLAGEVAEHGIDVNAIAPGAVNTRMLDQRLAAGAAVSAEEREQDQRLLREGDATGERAAALAVYLASTRSDGLTGRLLSAVWDPWETFDVEAIMATEAFAVRRVQQQED